MAKIAIIDYGIGNVRSVANAVEAVGGEAHVVPQPKDLTDFGHIILPGVGAFGDGMQRLQKGNWINALEKAVHRDGKTFLGICLGMQLLAVTGAEHGVHSGLGWFPGHVKLISTGNKELRVPHIGWNDVQFVDEHPLVAGLNETEVFYFVHSYVFIPENKKCIKGVCNLGNEFVAVVAMENIMATQFHPEKSQKAGLKILKNFLDIR